MRAPFLPSGSLAICTTTSWPAFNISEINCGRRDGPEWLPCATVLATASAGTAIESGPASAGAAATIESRAAFSGAAIFRWAAPLVRTAASVIGAAAFAAAAIIMTSTFVAGPARIAAASVTTGSAVAATTAAAERTLEARARIAAAYAGGIAWEIFARRARGHAGREFRQEARWRLLRRQRAFRRSGISPDSLATESGLLRGFVLRLRRGLLRERRPPRLPLAGRPSGSLPLLALPGVLLPDRLRSLPRFRQSAELGLALQPRLLLRPLQFRATDYGVDMSVFGSLLVFGFDEFGRKGSNLVVVEIDIATDGRLRTRKNDAKWEAPKIDFLVGFFALVGNSSRHSILLRKRGRLRLRPLRRGASEAIRQRSGAGRPGWCSRGWLRERRAVQPAPRSWRDWVTGRRFPAARSSEERRFDRCTAAAAGFSRYLARDSPGSRIGSSAGSCGAEGEL